MLFRSTYKLCFTASNWNKQHRVSGPVRSASCYLCCVTIKTQYPLSFSRPHASQLTRQARQPPDKVTSPPSALYVGHSPSLLMKQPEASTQTAGLACTVTVQTEVHAVLNRQQETGRKIEDIQILDYSRHNNLSFSFPFLSLFHLLFLCPTLSLSISLWGIGDI